MTSRPENAWPNVVKSGRVGEREAHGAGPPLHARGQLPGEDRDEDDVVDAEDDLEHREGEERDPGLG